MFDGDAARTVLRAGPVLRRIPSQLRDIATAEFSGRGCADVGAVLYDPHVWRQLVDGAYPGVAGGFVATCSVYGFELAARHAVRAVRNSFLGNAAQVAGLPTENFRLAHSIDFGWAMRTWRFVSPGRAGVQHSKHDCSVLATRIFGCACTPRDAGSLGHRPRLQFVVAIDFHVLVRVSQSVLFERARTIWPKLHQRLLWPFPSLVFQAHNLWELAGTFQCILVGSLFLIAVCIAWRLRSRQLWELVGWSVASCYVLSAVAGIHPTLCYWLYPYCMILLTGCVAISHACEHGARRHQSPDGANDAQESTIDPRRRVVRWPLVALAIAGTLIMIPGAGLRASWVYLRHYGDPKVDSRKFIAKVLEDLPKEGLFMVDLSYVFDVYMSGRETVLHGPRDLYWGNSADHYRYLLIAWQGEDEHAAQEYGARLERQVGDPNTIGHCYVNIYVPK